MTVNIEALAELHRIAHEVLERERRPTAIPAVPTDAMLQAAYAAHGVDRLLATAVWRTMFDAARTQGEEKT